MDNNEIGGGIDRRTADTAEDNDSHKRSDSFEASRLHDQSIFLKDDISTNRDIPKFRKRKREAPHPSVERGESIDDEASSSSSDVPQSSSDSREEGSSSNSGEENENPQFHRFLSNARTNHDPISRGAALRGDSHRSNSTSSLDESQNYHRSSSEQTSTEVSSNSGGENLNRITHCSKSPTSEDHKKSKTENEEKNYVSSSLNTQSEVTSGELSSNSDGWSKSSAGATRSQDKLIQLPSGLLPDRKRTVTNADSRDNFPITKEPGNNSRSSDCSSQVELSSGDLLSMSDSGIMNEGESIKSFGTCQKWISDYPFYNEIGNDIVMSRKSSSTSSSDIDKIIARAKSTFKSRESSSFSDEVSSNSYDTSKYDHYFNDRGQSRNELIGEIKARIHEKKCLLPEKIRTHSRKRKYSEKRDSCGGSAVSSKSGSNGESGSLNTSCLDGIASDITPGDGGLSSGSGGENAFKSSEGSGSSSDSDIVTSEKDQATDTIDNEIVYKNNGDGSPLSNYHDTKARHDQVAMTKNPTSDDYNIAASNHAHSLKTNNDSVDNTQFEPYISHLSQPKPNIFGPAPSASAANNFVTQFNLPTAFDPALFAPIPSFHHVFPVYLDYCRMKQMESSLSKSKDSQQKLKDWDNMMDLNSSHSHTMNKSARSRKKLYNFTMRWLKKIGNHEDKK